MSGLRFGLNLSMQGRGGRRWRASDLFLPGSNGFLYDFSRADTQFREAAGITPAGIDDPVGLVLDTSKWGGNHASQATSGARPVRKMGGLIRYDGSDDNLLTTFNPAAATSLAFHGKIGDLTQIIVGAQNSNGRCYISTGASGSLAAGVGAQNFYDITAGPDIRNVLGVGVLTCNGSVVKLYWNGAEIYSAAQSGVTPSTTPFMVGAHNNNGTPSNFASADLYRALAIDRALTPAEITKLTNYWSAP